LHFYKWQGRIYPQIEYVTANLKEEMQSIVATALANMEEKMASAFQPQFAFAA